MTTAEYLLALNSRFRLGNATEHTFRGDLQNLLESLAPGISATNEPKRQACGAPDNLILTGFSDFSDQIAKGLGLTFVSEPAAQGDRGGEVCFAESEEVMPAYRQTFAPIDLLDYIYAVLHSPTYRETYKEFLKIDFPRVPYPTDAEAFWKMVALGGELRQLHLMESPTLSQFITQYPVGGENEVEKIRFVPSSRGRNDRSDLPEESASLRATQERSNLPDDETASAKSLAVTGRVYINSDQYFDSVPELAWNFYIGGYQPAQKWLKDRKGRILDFEDIMYYQRIIKALTETERVMGEIDGVGII